MHNIFGQWKEAGVPTESPYIDRDNMQTEHPNRKASARIIIIKLILEKTNIF